MPNHRPVAPGHLTHSVRALLARTRRSRTIVVAARKRPTPTRMPGSIDVRAVPPPPVPTPPAGALPCPTASVRTTTLRSPLAPSSTITEYTLPAPSTTDLFTAAPEGSGCRVND